VAHFDVQIQAGHVLAAGALAEMETGEGKTLAATLPACAAALAGVPVHVITANDYLVARDAAEMRPLYASLGLTVGAVTEAERDPARRRAAYGCDVTYGTAKGIAFDYLRDALERRRARAAGQRLAPGDPLADRLLLRGLCFAIVDEADAVLIDEAGMPLILSASATAPDASRSYRSAVRLARVLEEARDFRRDPRSGAFELTDAGRRRLEPLACPLGGFWTGPRRREEWVVRGLVALHGMVRDRDYLVREGRIEIIDPPTGRTAPDRSWEGGLHQMVEVKEGCAVTPPRETLARISYQRFFRRYLRLAGTTGTAREVARELWSVYGLRTVRIPTRLPVRRQALGARVFPTGAVRWDAVVARVREMHGAGRPVLVGTGSVGASEQLSALLAAAGLPHRVLNARQDAGEAAIVARAGEAGAITVATRMAGRGTDIRLGPGVAERGGLHVIATERGPARRIDRQLAGRCGRQGDPGSHELLLSLEDEPVVQRVPERLRRCAAWLSLLRPLGSFPEIPARGLTRWPQRAEEVRSARNRSSLVALDEVRDAQLAFAGRGE
jgi:preprotein translocase subunit SecA